MPKVSDEYRLARREEILDVAIQCFRAKGLARTSIADLTASSGLSAGAIYGNFPGGKEEIFHAAAARILQSRRSELARRRGDGALSPAEVMATIVAGVRSERVTLGILPQLWGEAAVDPEIRALVHSVFLELRTTIRDAVAEWATENPDRIDGDPHAWADRVTPVLLSSAPGFVLQQTLFPDFDGDAYLETLLEVLPR